MSEAVVLGRQPLLSLVDELVADGYTVVGPAVRSGAIVLEELAGGDELPAGWTEVQEAGRYRLERTGDEALFGYSLGPQSWKRWLFPPRLRLFQALKNGSGLEVVPDEPPDVRYAFIGARSCELHAIAVQDRILRDGPHVDPHYAARREGLFVIAVNCGQAGGTCFCVSMETGPRVESGYDLVVTELAGESGLRYLVEVGSKEGRALLERVDSSPATAADRSERDGVLAQTAAAMGRTLQTEGIRDLLMGNLEPPRWDDVASRCLGCTNCTLVCPTCFCMTVEDTTDLAGGVAERHRRWDSCFTLDHSYLHGGSVRSSTRARYRQWLTHKVATWIDQFGTSGCVGCGRCITWCPVGIDITEEVAAIRATDGRTAD